MVGHDHSHHSQDFSRAFAVGIALNTVYVFVEASVGLTTGSLGLVADAGHNASDVLSLVIAWAGANLAKRAPTERFTYGFSRSPILASLFNALLLFGAMAILAWEALQRFQDPTPVPGLTIVWVTLVGLAVNTGTALMFAKGRSDLNIRGAFLHMAADAAVTFGVLLAGLGIFYSGALWLDPAITLVIVAIVLWSTWGLFRDSLHLSLDAVPKGIDPAQVKRTLRGLPGVADVHDLHIWAMSATQTALTAHLVAENSQFASQPLIDEACRLLHDQFEIAHTTIQVEPPDAAGCPQRAENAL